MSEGEGGRAAGTACASGNNQTVSKSVTQNGNRKWLRILRLLAGGAALTRFDAERHGDHALNSTIFQISRVGITVSRKPITISLWDNLLQILDRARRPSPGDCDIAGADMIALKLTGSRCRCSACGDRFNLISVFDRHRVGSWDNHGANRRCLTVAEMQAKGWRLNVRGFWLERSRLDVRPWSGDPIEVDMVGLA